MKKIIGVLFLSIIMMTTIVFAAYPSELENSENEEGLIDLMPGDMARYETTIVEDDIYKIDKEVVIQEIVDGNVYVIASKLKIDGAMIYGNIYAIANEIEINDSEIGGSVYVLGEDIKLSGLINDLYAIGNEISFEENSNIYRTARVLAKELNVSGMIGRDLYASVGNMNINDRAVINGKLNYSSEKESNISENAQIADTQFTQIKEDVTEEDVEAVYEYGIGNVVMKIVKAILKTAVISLIIILLVNKFRELKRESVTIDLLKEMCKGIGVLVIVPIISILLMFSIIGLGLGVSLFVIYGLLLYIATSVTATEISYRIMSAKAKSNAQIIGISVLVSVIIEAIGFVPVIGGIVKFIVLLMGLGILFDMIFKRIKKEENNGEINEN